MHFHHSSYGIFLTEGSQLFFYQKMLKYGADGPSSNVEYSLIFIRDEQNAIEIETIIK